MTRPQQQAHTPGPWSVDRLGKVRCAAEGGKGFIADPGDGRYAGSVPRDPEISLANARLIAAAPDLLAALENLLTYDRVERPAFRAKPEGAPNSDARIRQDKLIALEDAARAAIAKASGEAKAEGERT